MPTAEPSADPKGEALVKALARIDPAAMTGRRVPARHWRCYGDQPLPTGAEALDEPFRAFPSWFLRIVCDRCGKERLFSETHAAQGEMLIRDILARMRHDGCGGQPGRAELVTTGAR